MMFLPNNDVNLSVRQQFACPCETQLKYDAAGVCHQPQFKLYWGRQALLLPPEIHSPFSFQRILCPGPSKKYMTLADVLLGEMSIFTRQRTPSTPLVECCSALMGSDHQLQAKQIFLLHQESRRAVLQEHFKLKSTFIHPCARNEVVVCLSQPLD